MNRILIVLLVVALVVGGYMFYNQQKTGSVFGNGDVVAHDTGTTEKNSMDSGAADLDGKPIGDATPTPSRSDAPGTINGDPVAAGAATNQPPASQKAPIATETYSSGTGNPGTPPPASDTIIPNPPNGMAFTGTGKYQWYRQGNLTWRVDTGSGSSCIAFATMPEWQKPIVYTHGCGNA